MKMKIKERWENLGYRTQFKIVWGIAVIVGMFPVYLIAIEWALKQI